MSNFSFAVQLPYKIIMNPELRLIEPLYIEKLQCSPKSRVTAFLPTNQYLMSFYVFFCSKIFKIYCWYINKKITDKSISIEFTFKYKRISLVYSLKKNTLCSIKMNVNMVLEFHFNSADFESSFCATVQVFAMCPS